MAGQTVAIDGFNVITTVEAALAGGAVLVGREGCYRDMASMHGSYRKVDETLDAVRIIGSVLAAHGPAACLWYLDRPVGNSGRLRALLRDEAAVAGWSWTVHVVDDPDSVLRDTDAIVASADSGVLDHTGSWVNLARAAVEQVETTWLVDLR